LALIQETVRGVVGSLVSVALTYHKFRQDTAERVQKMKDGALKIKMLSQDFFSKIQKSAAGINVGTDSAMDYLYTLCCKEKNVAKVDDISKEMRNSIVINFLIEKAMQGGELEKKILEMLDYIDKIVKEEVVQAKQLAEEENKKQEEAKQLSSTKNKLTIS
jgi:hypothetical protein